MFELSIIIIYLNNALLVNNGLSRKSSSSNQLSQPSESTQRWIIDLFNYTTYLSRNSFFRSTCISIRYNWNAFVFGIPMCSVTMGTAKYFVPFYRKKIVEVLALGFFPLVVISKKSDFAEVISSAVIELIIGVIWLPGLLELNPARYSYLETSLNINLIIMIGIIAIFLVGTFSQNLKCKNGF